MGSGEPSGGPPFSYYDQYMMSKNGVPGKFGAPHRKWLDAISKNYGCEACIWQKWHGERFGYPDMNPKDFK